VTYYSHPAKEAEREPGDTRRECFVCGVEVKGFGPTLTHVDETIRTIAVDKAYMPAFRAASSVAEEALSKVTNRAPDDERARAIVAALYEAGYLRQKAVLPTVKAKP
jgi:hypothetical protein